ncbi:MAG TPA: hypothetical protein VNR60_05140 [Croceibacterium sp.]|nr:hypothetical protein [Croceibacterium sp.]
MIEQHAIRLPDQPATAQLEAGESAARKFTVASALIVDNAGEAVSAEFNFLRQRG